MPQKKSSLPFEVLQEEFTRYKLLNKEPWEDHKVQTRQRITIRELIDIDCKSLFAVGFGNWDGNIMLVPLYAIRLIKKGETLTDISNKTYIVGKDKIDNDTRGGCIAYGFVHPGLKEFAE